MNGWHAAQIVRKGSDCEYVFVELLMQDWGYRIRIEVCDEAAAHDLAEVLSRDAMSVTVEAKAAIIGEMIEVTQS